ncbi:MAG TPA: TIGR03668 family PPOX class F420-dependent oxidoreductase [Blastocatellia bacterium]
MDEDAVNFIANHRVAHLATATSEGQPSVVPICYVFDSKNIYSSIDQKPKSVPAQNLTRLRNIQSNSKISLVVDDYSDDWDKLAYVLVTGTAIVLWPTGDSSAEHEQAVAMLRNKYEQYRRMPIETTPIVKIHPLKVKMWSYGQRTK